MPYLCAIECHQKNMNTMQKYPTIGQYKKIIDYLLEVADEYFTQSHEMEVTVRDEDHLQLKIDMGHKEATYYARASGEKIEVLFLVRMTEFTPDEQEERELYKKLKAKYDK